MRSIAIQFNLYIITLVLGLFPISGLDCLLAKSKVADFLKDNDEIIFRLNGEWNQIESISNNLMALEEIIVEMRDLELYPAEVTNLNEKNLIRYDKALELLEKKCKLAKQQISLVKAPIVDALEIIRQMVLSEVVPGMFIVLERGEKKRTKEAFHIKQNLDSLWKTSDSLITRLMDISSVSVNTEKETFDEDVYSKIKLNINDKQKKYYIKIDQIKKGFSKKANPVQIEEMFKIDKFSLQKLMEQEKYSLARQKINSMKSRYTGKESVDEINYLHAKVEFSDKNYEQVLSILSSIPDTFRNMEMILALKIQSLYTLKDYKKIWDNYRNFEINRLHGIRKNLLVWILIECGISLRIEDDYAHLASLIDNTSSYTYHVLHALARTYMINGDLKTALSIMESALKYKIVTENDKIAFKEIKIAIAQIYYEMSDYEKSLNLFYQLLSEHGDFERALFGVVWCYLKLNNYSKAETALKKLINLTPDSPLAAEAVILLAEKTIVKANSEWKKYLYLEKEKKRLFSKLDYVLGKLETVNKKEEKEKYVYAQKELNSLIHRIVNEKTTGYDSLKMLYDKVDKICNLINTHYKTGTFQEDKFTEKRERVLFYLDSTISEIKNNESKEKTEQMISNAKNKREKIKNAVKKMNVFAVIASIDKYRWEREYIDWKKTSLRAEEVKIDSNMNSNKDSKELIKLKEKKSTIKKTLDSIIVEEEKKYIKYADKLNEKIDTILLEDIDSNTAAYFNYQSGELWYLKENINYAELYNKFETEMNRYYILLSNYRDGKIQDRPLEPSIPLLDHSNSLKRFRKIIDNYTQSDYLSAAYYSIAWCFNDLGEYDSSLHYMEKLAVETPQSQYAAQAWMYSGEHHFEKGNLNNAVKSYQAVLRSPESEWFEEALYKMAWSQYRMLNPEKAISSFLALVDLGDGDINGAALLRKESMDYIAISFSEADVTGEKGLERAMAFVNRLQDDENGCRILHRLADVFKEQGRYEIAKKTYNNLLKKYPKYPKNPFIETEIVKLTEREAGAVDINRLKMKLYEKYNRNSSWAMKQSEYVRNSADSVASKSLYDAAIGFHQRALQKNDTAVYNNAMNAYKNYISVYSTSPVANECHYNLAEILFAIGKYDEAAEEYMAVTKRYPDSKYRENAAWNAIVASQNFLKLENEGYKNNKK